jgi:putative DNA methylase
MQGMRKAMAKMATAAHPDYPLTLYYAFKQAEVEREGVASTGWATFLEALIGAGFAIDGTWPVRTERSARSIGIGTNALATSIVLVCRKREATAPVTTRSAFLRALRAELPARLKLLQQGNIAPVDMAQASIGPGMSIFTRYARVLEADDRPMTVKTALQLINQALDEYLSEQEAEYDADTRFAITWFDSYGMEAGLAGQANVLANARNVSVAGVAASGILALKGDKVRLLARNELPEGWDPGKDPRLTVWECTQHLIRVLESEGETSAAVLLARLGARADPGRDLAYRLYGICERRKWAEEAVAYNGLVVVWPELARLAAQAPATAAPQGKMSV